MQEPTRVHKHTLDVLISSNTSTVISNVVITDPGKLTRPFNVNIKKPWHIGKHVSFRRIGNTNDAFLKKTTLSLI